MARIFAETDTKGLNAKKVYRQISADMEDYIASDSVKNLCEYLMRYYGKKVILFLDEYDTPMQEAYVNGHWDDGVSFVRNLFNATFNLNSRWNYI